MSVPRCATESPALTLVDLEYELPAGLIAQAPADPRDASRLLVYRGARRELQDRSFSELPALLRAGDVLVRNDTRVFPARSFFRRATGGRIEALFLQRVAVGGSAAHPSYGAGEDTTSPDSPVGGERWEVLLRGRPRPGEVLLSEELAEEWPLLCERPLGDGRWHVMSQAERPVHALLERVGVTPLPPYIRAGLDDPERYQTIYASAVGSAAAPTAGLHFTAGLDAALCKAGITIETVTLHVGLGTFKPLQEETLAASRLHSERYEVEASTWRRLRAARAEGRRVIAVGTTTLRTLEHLARDEAASAVGEEPQAARVGGGEGGAVKSDLLRGETDLFITPGFDFLVADGLLTNFHLPRTSLLALVMAFCGIEATWRIYRHAVAEGYRFYSFGDAMLAL